MRKRIFLILMIAFTLTLTACGLKGTYKKYSSTSFGYTLPEGYTEVSKQVEQHIHGYVEQKDSMEYDIYSWELSKSILATEIIKDVEGNVIPGDTIVTPEDITLLIDLDLSRFDLTGEKLNIFAGGLKDSEGNVISKGEITLSAYLLTKTSENEYKETCVIENVQFEDLTETKFETAKYNGEEILKLVLSSPTENQDINSLKIQIGSTTLSFNDSTKVNDEKFISDDKAKELAKEVLKKKAEDLAANYNLKPQTFSIGKSGLEGYTFQYNKKIQNINTTVSIYTFVSKTHIVSFEMFTNNEEEKALAEEFINNIDNWNKNTQEKTEGKYQQHNNSRIGYVVPKDFVEVTKEKEQYLFGTIKQKDSMEYEIYSWNLPKSILASEIPESGEYVDDEDFITESEAKALAAEELKKKAEALVLNYYGELKEVSVNEFNGYSFEYTEQIASEAEENVVVYCFVDEKRVVVFKIYTSNDTEVEFAKKFIYSVEKYKEPFKFHDADKGLLIIIAIVVAGIVAFYFLQPIIRRKEYEEQRANFVKREATFRENLENLQSEKENKEKKN